MKAQSEQKTLQAFCEFLEANGYLDSDWREETPTAIDRFASQFKSQLPIEQKPTFAIEDMREACRKQRDLCFEAYWDYSCNNIHDEDGFRDAIKDAKEPELPIEQKQFTNDELSELIQKVHEDMEGRYDLDGFDLGNIQHYLCQLRGKFTKPLPIEGVEREQQTEQRIDDLAEQAYKKEIAENANFWNTDFDADEVRYWKDVWKKGFNSAL